MAAQTPQTTSETPTKSNTDKPIDEWVTGDEPMTGAQSSYLSTLASETDTDPPDTLTKAEASEMIDRLRAESARIEDADGV